MLISTTGFYDRSADRMARLNAQADTLQTRIATGKTLTAASQDAAGWQRLAGLKQAATDDAAWGANVKLAQGLLAQTDSTLGAIDNQVARARELAVRANGGTLSAEAMAAIAVELEGIVADLNGLAATRDARGQPLFDRADPVAIPIGDGIGVQVGEDGRRLFGGTGAPAGAIDLAGTIATFAAAIRDGGDVPAAAQSAIGALADGTAQISAIRASAGARAMRLDVEAQRLATAGVAREEARSALEDTDIASAITDLQKTLTVLQATQASFSKLTQLSLFDYVR